MEPVLCLIEDHTVRAFHDLVAKLSVCIVEMAGRVFLLGVTEQNIRLLAEITDEEEIERLHRRSLASPLSGDFREQFSGLSDLVQRIPPLFRKK